MGELAIVIPKLGLGGAERSAIKLTNAMLPYFSRIHIICLTTADSQMVEEFLPASAVALHQLCARSSASPRLWWRVRQLLNRISPECVVGWSTFGNLVASVACPTDSLSRLVLSERIYLPLMWGRKAEGAGLHKRMVRCAIRSLYRRADVITANSAASLRALRRYVGPGPAYMLLPNTINLDDISARSLAPISPPPPNRPGPKILALGRLVRQKGFDILLTSMKEVRRSEEWSLVVVGDGPEESRLRGQAIALGIADSVFWVGKCLNPYPWLRWADMVVVPSRFEGFPNVALEAMILGRPLICTNCKTGPEELTRGGEFGHLVPVEDAGALADAILQVGRNPLERELLANRARNHAIQTYEESVVRECYRIALGGTP